MDHDYVSNKRKDERLNCEKCGTSLSKKSNYYKHIKRSCKGVMKEKNFKCPNCTDAFLTKKDYIGHLKTVHDINFDPRFKNFESFDNFLQWKLEEERASITKFILYKTEYNDDGSRKVLYHCHRDGFFKSESSGQRNLKKLGSNKINGHCPAKMIVNVSSSGSCVLEYIFTHVGHDFEIERLRLTKAERDELAQKLSQKVPLDVILDEVRDSPVDKNVSRIHLLTKKDLFNIVSLYKLDKNEVKYRDDPLSLDAWVELMQRSANNVVRFYKPKDQVLEEHLFLGQNDFILIVFNDAQLDILKEYGNDVVCIDRTHDLDSHDYELFSILVLDEATQGFPVAFMISNRSDMAAMALFFQVIKTCLGEPLRTKIFMSDLPEDFFSAWSSIMPSANTDRLYCSWHVDRVWKTNLNKIKTKEKEISVFKTLKVLAMQSDESQFIKMSQTFLDDLCNDADCKDFAQYIQSFLASPAPWAHCYRKNSGFNSNLYLESLHQSLTHVYLKGKPDRRFDRGIQAVMGLVRDKLYIRFATLSKDRITKKLSVLKDRHHAAIKSTLVGKQIQNGSWVVSSSAGKDHRVRVNQNIVNNCTCHVRCSHCNNACIHEYSCTCVDYSIKWNMCKHIHYVLFFFNPSRDCSESPSNMDTDTLQDPNDYKFSYELTPEASHFTVLSPEQVILEQKKEECLEFFESILEEVHTVEQSEAIMNYIAPLRSVIEAAKQNSLNITVNKSLPSSSAALKECTTAELCKKGSSSPKNKNNKRKHEDAAVENPTNDEAFFIEKILKGEFLFV